MAMHNEQMLVDILRDHQLLSMWGCGEVEKN